MDALRQQPPRRGKIVIVEDDARVRRSLQLLLTGQGFEVRAYPSARGLGSDPEAPKSDCLVADLIMPDSDGLALLRQLRHAGWTGPCRAHERPSRCGVEGAGARRRV